MAERALDGPKVDHRLYRKISERFDGADYAVFGALIGVISVIGVLVLGAIFASPWIFLTFVPLALWIIAGIGWMMNSEPMDRYSSDRTFYQNAYWEYERTVLPEARQDSKTLLDNIWSHEVAFDRMSKKHESKYDCQPCYQRLTLIRDIREDQKLPGTDTSDIEAIESKRQVYKELGI